MTSRFLVANLFVVIFGMTNSLMAQVEPSRYTAEVFKKSTDETLNYRFLTPAKLEPEKKYPLVLFLHGAGERGDDNISQLVHVAHDLEAPEMSVRYPTFVLAPQCPKDQKWVEVNWEAPSHEMSDAPAEPTALTLEVLQDTLKNHPIDPNRIYVVGLSMGGYGTWDLLQRHPELFAAGIPICGGGDEHQAEKLTSLPIWAFHGSEDTAVRPERSRNMVESIRALNGKQILYTEYEGVGHDSWSMTAKNRLVWDWLFQQKK